MPAVSHSDFVLLAPIVLFAGAALQLLVAPLFSARVKGVLAAVSCVPAVFGVAALAGRLQSGQAIDLNLSSWDGPLTLAFHIDGLSVLFAGMGTVLGAIVLLYSVGYMAHERAATRFYATMLVFIGAFVGLVYSANLFLLYLCWEVIGLCSFSLVGFWYTQREAVDGARKVLLMTHIAGYGLLAAILILYHRTGSALWTDPGISHAFSIGVFLLMLLAIVAKSVQVPLHTWIPDAMAAPTPVSSLLHAACYVTAGVYLAARMHSFGLWPPEGSAILIVIGTVTMAVGVMYAMVQSDLKRMLAFSTVSQIGYMMLGLGIGSPLAITGALLHCLNHGFFKGGLFLNAGAVQHAAGTRDMNELGGLSQRMPRTTLFWLIGVGNMAGIPLMSGFVSKWMLYAAALQAGWTIPALIALLVSLGTVFLCAKATSIVFLGPATEKTREAHEATPTMQWAMGLMATGSLALGVAPQLAVNYLLNPVLSALHLGSGMQVTWFGMFSGAGTFSTAGGLVLALVSLVAGAAIYALAYVARPVRTHAMVAVGAGGAASAGGDIFTGGEPLSDLGRLTARDFSDFFQQNWKEFFRWTNVDRVYLTVWRGLEAVSRFLAIAVSWMERHATVLVVAGAALVFAFVQWIVPAPSGSYTGAQLPVPTAIIAAIAVAASGLFFASLASGAKRKLPLWPCMLIVGGLSVAGLMVANPLLRVGLLESAAMLTVVRVWITARSRAAKYTYLAAVLISVFCAIGSEVLAQGYSADYFEGRNWPWSRALLLTGVVVKLAAVPMLFWLMSLADEIPALVLGLIIAVVDMAAVGELYVLAHVNPNAFAPQTLWLAIAVITSLVAAFLMLSQRSLKRLLVLSTIEDAGFLILGLVSGNELGFSGLIAAAATHSLAKTLLFACLSAPDRDGILDSGHTGLAARYPVSAFGFLFGMLAMLGVPPTLGFIGRWRLYSAALNIHPFLLAAFVLASIFALIAYVRAFTRAWWGPPREPDSARPGPITLQRRVLSPPVFEPLLLKTTIVLLVAILLIGGLFPDSVMQFVQGGRQ